MKKLLLITTIAAFALSMHSCKSKPKDEDIRTAAMSALAANPDLNAVMVDVKDGVATLTGEVKDGTAQSAAGTAVSSVNGVKSVVNNTTVAPPPAPVTPPVISADDPLTKGVADALKDHPSVKATVQDGVITVTGETTTANWRKIKMALDALRPKRVDASGLSVK